MDQDRIENGICLAVVVIAVLFCASISRGDDAEYWKAKATSAIAISTAVDANPWNPDPANKPDVPPPPKADATKRPIVTMYAASWCSPCQQAKAELKAATLPFDLKIVDVSNGGQPSWCGSLPGFGWDVKGQTRYVLGWPGLSSLVKRWEASHRSVKAVSANNYTPRWSWPGELRRHLESTHRVPGASGLTQYQAEKLHDALHEGHSLSAIKKYAAKHPELTK